MTSIARLLVGDVCRGEAGWSVDDGVRMEQLVKRLHIAGIARGEPSEDHGLVRIHTERP